LRFIR